MNNSKIFVFTFIVFWLIFAPTSVIIPDPTYNGWVKNILILFMVLSFRKDLSNFLSGPYKSFNLSVLFFCVISILSVIVNSDTINKYATTGIIIGDETYDILGITSPKASIYYSLSLIALTIFIEKLSIENKVSKFFDYLFKISVVFLIWIDIDAFQHVVVNDNILGYVLRDKFAVCYYNLYVCTLYYLLHPYLHRRESIIMLLLLILSFLIAVHTQCSTMVIGTVLYFLFLYIFPKRKRFGLSSGITLVSMILILDIGFFFLVSWLLQFEFVQTIIVDVLHEDLTLSGRLGIFERIMDAFQEHPWFGYGNGNSRVICMYYGCGSNPQNGIIEVFLNTGLLGCLSFLALIYQGAKCISIKDWYKFPVVIYLLVMIIVSTIEVPFEITFIFFVILSAFEIPELTRDQNQIEKWSIKI